MGIIELKMQLDPPQMYIMPYDNYSMEWSPENDWNYNLIPVLKWVVSRWVLLKMGRPQKSECPSRKVELTCMYTVNNKNVVFGKGKCFENIVKAY